MKKLKLTLLASLLLILSLRLYPIAFYGMMDEAKCLKNAFQLEWSISSSINPYTHEMLFGHDDTSTIPHSTLTSLSSGYYLMYNKAANLGFLNRFGLEKMFELSFNIHTSLPFRLSGDPGGVKSFLSTDFGLKKGIVEKGLFNLSYKANFGISSDCLYFLDMAIKNSLLFGVTYKIFSFNTILSVQTGITLPPAYIIIGFLIPEIEFNFKFNFHNGFCFGLGIFFDFQFIFNHYTYTARLYQYDDYYNKTTYYYNDSLTDLMQIGIEFSWAKRIKVKKDIKEKKGKASKKERERAKILKRIKEEQNNINE